MKRGYLLPKGCKDLADISMKWKLLQGSIFFFNEGNIIKMGASVAPKHQTFFWNTNKTLFS